jgi:hypothetical protein
MLVERTIVEQFCDPFPWVSCMARPMMPNATVNRAPRRAAFSSIVGGGSVSQVAVADRTGGWPSSSLRESQLGVHWYSTRPSISWP